MVRPYKDTKLLCPYWKTLYIFSNLFLIFTLYHLFDFQK